MHSPVSSIRTAPGVWSGIVNLLFAYLPAFLRIAMIIRRTPADLVFVTAIPLSPLALLHKMLFRSRIVLDLNERPGMADVNGSLFSYISRLEPVYVRLIRRLIDMAWVVTPGHVPLAERLGVRAIRVVKNAPLASWRCEPESSSSIGMRDGGAIRLVCIGTVAPGRFYMELCRAVAQSRQAGVLISVDLYGPANDQFLRDLEDCISVLGLTEIVQYRGIVADSDVCRTYQRYDAGLALYDPAFTASDSLSNKIIECVAAGVPVLAGDLPENQRFLTDRHVGRSVRLTVEALAEALTALTAQDLSRWREEAIACGANLTWENEIRPVLYELGVSDKARSNGSAHRETSVSGVRR